MILKKGKNLYYINPTNLVYLLSGNFPPDDKLINKISDGVLGLFKQNIITVSQQYRKHEDRQYEWIIDTDLMGIPKKDDTQKHTEFYSIVNEYDINKIFNIESKYFSYIFSLTRFYVYLLSTSFKKDKYKGVGFTSIQDMAATTGYHEKTISKYIKQLEVLQLIYVYRAKDIIMFDNGTFAEISHTYGRYCDKDKICKIGKEHEQEYGSKFKSEIKKVKKINGDKTRSYSQRYNRMMKELECGKENPYDYNELKEIFLSMYELNKKYENECRTDRHKPLDIFKDYDFYKE